MKFRAVVFLITLFTLVYVAVAQEPAAQAKPAQHHHYTLIDLGTLGGPQSFQIDEEQPLAFAGAPATRMINSRVAVTGVADLNMPDPYAPFCLIDCNLEHAFLWENGEMTDLGALPGTNDSFPNWINDRGELAGASFNGVDPASGAPLLEAVLWKEGSVIDLGDLPGGNQSIANGLNDRGDVVGAAVNATPDPFPNLWAFLFYNNVTEPHAVLWSDGAITDLGTLGGPDSLAIFVNNSGQIAGQSLTDSVVNPSTGQATQHPFLWQNGEMIDLGTLGGTLGFPTGLNNRGQVIGLMNIAGDVTFHGFLWDRGSLIDLGTLGGARSLASWINDSGEVLGISNMPGDQSWHGFVWKNGVKTDIGTVDDDPCIDPSRLNASGQAVGKTTDCHSHIRHTFLWENGSIVDLQSLVSPASQITIKNSLSINDRGEIAATGSLPNGDTHSLLLIPCDDDHPNVEGCDYSMVDVSVAKNNHTAQRPVAVTPQTTSSPTQTVNQLRNRWIQRYRLAGQRPASHE